MFSYHYRVKLSRELAIFKALDSVSQSRDQIFQKLLNPRKFRTRFELDPRDPQMGRLEKYLQEAEKEKKLVSNQGGPLGSYLGLYKESFLIFNGRVTLAVSHTFLVRIGQDAFGPDTRLHEAHSDCEGALPGGFSTGPLLCPEDRPLQHSSQPVRITASHPCLAKASSSRCWSSTRQTTKSPTRLSSQTAPS